MQKRNVVLLFVGIFMFFFGLHNIDNGFNMHTVNTQTGAQFVDRSFGGVNMDAFSLYGTGMILTIFGFMTSCFACLEIREHFKKSKINNDEMDDYLKM